MCFMKKTKPQPSMAPPEPPPPPPDMEPDVGGARKAEDEAMNGTTQAPDLRVDKSAGGGSNRAGGTGLSSM